jgi:NADPH-dependent curcumin reductase CurA
MSTFPMQLHKPSIAFENETSARKIQLKRENPQRTARFCSHRALATSRRWTISSLPKPTFPSPGPAQMLLRTIYLSLDPYMRGRRNAGPSYAPRVEIGAVMGGQSVCEVVESNRPNYEPGDIVLAATGWQAFSLFNGKETQRRKSDMTLVECFCGPCSGRRR